MRAEEERKQERYDEVGYDPDSPAHVVSKAMQRENQERFLNLFAKCLSPNLACKQAGISQATYAKWRSTDVQFAERLNEIMEGWRAELISSAVTRAIGYTAVDDQGSIQTDASGKVIYHGASDQLAKALLALDGDEHRKSRSEVSVTINLTAFGATESPAVIAHEHGHLVVDGETSELVDSGSD
jgi:hypothetical protein